MVQAIKHVYGKCPCGQYHKQPKSSNVVPLRKEKPLTIQRNTIWDTRAWTVIKIGVKWLIQPLVFGAIFGVNFGSATLGGVVAIFFFLWKLSIKISYIVWNRIKENINQKS